MEEGETAASMFILIEPKGGGDQAKGEGGSGDGETAASMFILIEPKGGGDQAKGEGGSGDGESSRVIFEKSELCEGFTP